MNDREVISGAADDARFQHEMQELLSSLLRRLKSMRLDTVDMPWHKKIARIAFARFGSWGLGLSNLGQELGHDATMLEMHTAMLRDLFGVEYLILLAAPANVRLAPNMDGSVLAGALTSAFDSFVHEFRHMVNRSRGAPLGSVNERSPLPVYFNNDQEFDSFYHEALARYFVRYSPPVGVDVQTFIAKMIRVSLNQMFVQHLNHEQWNRLLRRLYLFWSEFNKTQHATSRIEQYMLDNPPSRGLLGIVKRSFGRRTVRRAVARQGVA